jgi:phospholipid transport system substrate-binding protein
MRGVLRLTAPNRVSVQGHRTKRKEFAPMSTQTVTRRAAIRLSLLGAAAGVVLSGPHAAWAQDSGAAAPIAQLDAALLGAMKAGQATPFSRRYAMLEPAVERAFDLRTVLQTSVGPHWATLSPDQQASLLAAFRRYTVANYTANFDHWDGQDIAIAPTTRTVGADQVVTTTIGRPGGSSTVLAYVMRQGADGWRAVDVLADGSISRVAVQRSDFRNVLARGGGPALLASLQQKVSDLSGGALA